MRKALDGQARQVADLLGNPQRAADVRVPCHRSSLSESFILLGMCSNADESVATAMALERRLLQPAVRASAAALDALLDPEFEEIGACGRAVDPRGHYPGVDP